MKRPAKKAKINKSVIGAVGAAVAGMAAGAAAMFLAKKENRTAVKRTVEKTVRSGKAEMSKAKKTVSAARKKFVKK